MYTICMHTCTSFHTQDSFCVFCGVKICVQVSRLSGGIALVTVCLTVPLFFMEYLFFARLGDTGKQQQRMSFLPERLRRKSRLTIAGNISNMAARLNNSKIPACMQNVRRAGIGIIAAAKKAATFVRPVSSTDRPVRLRTTPVCSLLGTSFTDNSAYVCVSRNMSCTARPRARNGTICVVMALNGIPRSAQKPNPAAIVAQISITPAIPTPDCERTGSFHRKRTTPAYSNWKNKMKLHQ